MTVAREVDQEGEGLRNKSQEKWENPGGSLSCPV